MISDASATRGAVLRSRALLVGLSALGCACGTFHNGPIFEPVTPPTQSYTTESAQVFILEARSHVAHERAFDTPFFSWPGQAEQRPLQLSAEASARMAALLKRWVPRVGSDQVYFEVYVEQADAGWRANWFSEEARAQVELCIRAIDGLDQRPLLAGWARSWGIVHSADVTDQEPANLLDDALLDAWARWLQNDRVILRVNQALAAKRRWGWVPDVVSCRR